MWSGIFVPLGRVSFEAFEALGMKNIISQASGQKEKNFGLSCDSGDF